MTQKELGYVELEWTCKHCNTINPGMQRVCTNCGAPVELEDKLTLPDQQVLITDQAKLAEAKKGPSIQCPYCNTVNPAGANNCLQCGGDIQAGLARQAGGVLGAHSTAAIPDKPCPSCGRLVSVNAQRCPHCGGSLVSTAEVAALPKAMPKKLSIWMIIGIALASLACVASVIAFIALSSRTSDVTASVSALQWQRSIDILSQQPVQRSAWEGDVPSQAKDVACQDKYRETSSFPVPKSTEVCGTPYVVDQGSGAGKVVQDCVYQVYASYCTYTVLDWTVINTAMAEGSDNQPEWPAIVFQASQKEGERHESYKVTFSSAGETYAYTPLDVAEFSQFELQSKWVLEINTFGQIKELHSK